MLTSAATDRFETVAEETERAPSGEAAGQAREGKTKMTIRVAAWIVMATWLAASVNAEEVRPGVLRTTSAGLTADDIPVAHTPPGYWTTMPAPILEDCTEPLVEGAPDMRGLWKVVEATPGGEPTKTFLGSVQRIEQCGNRVIVTGGGVTHDMRCDGTYENGVNDIGERSTGGRAISVAASFENGVHILRPKGAPGITVEREMKDGDLLWRYGPTFALRLERVEE